jgi:ferrochelatase
MLAVAEHYYHFGGRSPINDQNRRLIAAIEGELAAHGPQIPVYWGNRNWHPLLADTLRKMADDGIRRALAFVTSAFSSYSGCRQYREDIARAQQAVESEGKSPPQVDKLRVFFNHPGFIEPMIEKTRQALDHIPPDRRERAQLVFTAHSIPQTMADGCRYEAQLHEAIRLVAEGVKYSLSLGVRVNAKLVYQSRSGSPQQRWLEPDVCDYLRELRESTSDKLDVIIVPIGFISDHMEVIYDLDTETRQLCDELGINMIRAGTVGTHPRFIRMIQELITERTNADAPRLAIGTLGPSYDVCPVDCCLYSPSAPAREES